VLCSASVNQPPLSCQRHWELTPLVGSVPQSAVCFFSAAHCVAATCGAVLPASWGRSGPRAAGGRWSTATPPWPARCWAAAGSRCTTWCVLQTAPQPHACLGAPPACASVLRAVGRSCRGCPRVHICIAVLTRILLRALPPPARPPARPPPQLRRSAFADVLVACGAAGVCFVKNDRAGEPFQGTVLVQAVDLRYDARTHAPLSTCSCLVPLHPLRKEPAVPGAVAGHSTALQAVPWG
jgi:hypothetical protein